MRAITTARFATRAWRLVDDPMAGAPSLVQRVERHVDLGRWPLAVVPAVQGMREDKMSDHNQNHDLDDAPKTEPVASTDIIGSVIVGQSDDGFRYAGAEDLGVCVIADANARAEFFKRMAFEADRQCKQADAALIEAKLRIEAMRHLVKAADKELSLYQSSNACDTTWPTYVARRIANARAALRKAVEE